MIRILRGMALCAAFACSAQANLIFDVDFESPPHVLGSAPTFGSGSDTPTDSNGFGWSIEESIADFSSQVAVVGGTGFEFMGFHPAVAPSSGVSTISWELSVLQTGTEPQANITIESVDGPTPVTVLFRGNGNVDIADPVLGSTTVGLWTQNVSAEYMLALDLDANTYDFFIDASPVVADQSFGVSTELQRVNFYRPFDSPSYAIDNFQWQVIPEPSSLLLMAFTGLAVFLRRRYAR